REVPCAFAAHHRSNGSAGGCADSPAQRSGEMSLRLVLAALLSFCASAQPPTTAPRPPARPAAGRGGVAAASYKDLKFGPMRPFDPVQPVRFDLSNGMKVLLLEDHDTPMVTATAVIRTGSVFDPPHLAGLAALTGSVIRAG